MDVTELEGIPTWEWPDEGRAAVAEALRTGSHDQRLLAVELAGDLYDDELFIGLLTDAVAGDPDAEVRAAAALSLGPALESAFGEPGKVDPATIDRARRVLRETFDDSAQPDEVRRRALEGAVRAPLPWMAAAIRAACASADPGWRTTGVFAAARAGDASLVPLVSAAIDDPEPDVRIEAVRALGVLEAGGEVPRLVRYLDASYPQALRLAVVEALGEIGDPAALAPLRAVDPGGDDDLAGALSEAVRTIGRAADR